jgi:hypothetical protein
VKGLFIPGITAEMFRNGCLESVEALMAEGEIYDIEYSPCREEEKLKALSAEPCDCISRKCSDGETTQPNYKALKIISETMMDMLNNKPFEEVMGNLENNMREMGIEVSILKEQEPCEDCISRAEVLKGKVIHQSCDGVEIINSYAVPVEYIEQLPSIQPKSKTDMLDKIRDEIERKACSGQWSDATVYGMLKAVAIVDKYTAEKE